MMVDREFGRNHGLDLLDGYRRDGSDRGRERPLYETQLERMTGSLRKSAWS